MSLVSALVALSFLFNSLMIEAPRLESRPLVVRAAATRSVAGWATWYRWHPGQAAAGPALRRMLGRYWRGRTVTVHFGHGVTRRLKLTDYCPCAPRHGIPTVIDVNRGNFPWPALGRVRVTVTR